jgi:hypothetical protein
VLLVAMLAIGSGCQSIASPVRAAAAFTLDASGTTV